MVWFSLEMTHDVTLKCFVLRVDRSRSSNEVTSAARQDGWRGREGRLSGRPHYLLYSLKETSLKAIQATIQFSYIQTEFGGDLVESKWGWTSANSVPRFTNYIFPIRWSHWGSWQGRKGRKLFIFAKQPPGSSSVWCFLAAAGWQIRRNNSNYQDTVAERSLSSIQLNWLSHYRNEMDWRLDASVQNPANHI